MFQDDEKLLEAVVASGDPGDAYKKRNWETIAAHCYGHSAAQCEARQAIYPRYTIFSTIISTGSNLTRKCSTVYLVPGIDYTRYV